MPVFLYFSLHFEFDCCSLHFCFSFVLSDYRQQLHFHFWLARSSDPSRGNVCWLSHHNRRQRRNSSLSSLRTVLENGSTPLPLHLRSHHQWLLSERIPQATICGAFGKLDKMAQGGILHAAPVATMVHSQVSRWLPRCRGSEGVPMTRRGQWGGLMDDFFTHYATLLILLFCVCSPFRLCCGNRISTSLQFSE